jgi:hypothetical protein
MNKITVQMLDDCKSNVSGGGALRRGRRAFSTSGMRDLSLEPAKPMKGG